MKLLLVLVALVAACILAACGEGTRAPLPPAPSTTPKPLPSGYAPTATRCEGVTARTPDGEVRTACVSPEEARLMELVAISSRDGGAPPSACKTIPTTATCASGLELAAGIDAIIHERQIAVRRAQGHIEPDAGAGAGAQRR